MAYVELTELTDYLRNTIVADEVEIQASLLAAENGVNSYCQRTFTVPTTATTRTFAPANSHSVTVPDIANTTNLVIVDDGSTVAAADYQLEIAPGLTGPIGIDGRTYPYTRIRRLSGWWHVDAEATLSITARWGWPAVPAEVVEDARKKYRHIHVAMLQTLSDAAALEDRVAQLATYLQVGG